METKFQTSFIPRKPLTQTSSTAAPEHQPTSLLLIIGVVIFIISLIAALCSYGWYSFLGVRQTQLKNDLVLLEKDFNLGLISQFKQTDTKIGIAEKLLANHVAMSQVFGIVSVFTAENIRFTTLDLSAPIDKTKGIAIKMAGYAPSYEALAFQSDKLGHLEELGLRNMIINPVISSPMQNQNSTVSFELAASIDPSSMLYSKAIGSTNSTNPASSGDATTK